MSPFIRAKKSIGEKGSQAKEKSVLETTPTESDIINTESEALTNEGTSEGAGIHLRRGSERNDGSYPEEQVQGLESRPGTNRTRGEGSRPADGEAANLVNEGREVRVAELGILNGSKTQTVRLVDANKETTAMKKARKDAESRGLKIKFFVGDNIAITEKTGEISAVRAYVLGDTMLVRADHPVYTADQLERHEAGHVRIERGEINQKDVRKRLEEIVGKEAVEGVAEAYADLYAGTGMTAEEIWEECICDFLGDINIFSKSANGSLVVNELINQTQAITKEQKAEPNQTRGSPEAEGKASREINTENTFSEVFSKKILDSFGITNVKDSIHVQRRVLQTLENENFFDNAEKRSRTVINQMSGMNIEINKSGIDETFSFNNFVRLGKFKKIAKLATIRKLPEIIQNGKVVADNIADKHHNSSNKTFAYIIYNIEIDQIALAVKLDIKKSPIKNKFWVHSIITEKNSTGLDVYSTNGTVTPYRTDAIDDIVSQKTTLVNKSEIKFSRELDIAYLDAVKSGDMATAQKMVDEAAKKAGYDKLFYHGSKKGGGFTKFKDWQYFTENKQKSRLLSQSAIFMG